MVWIFWLVIHSSEWNSVCVCVCGEQIEEGEGEAHSVLAFTPTNRAFVEGGEEVLHIYLSTHPSTQFSLHEVLRLSDRTRVVVTFFFLPQFSGGMHCRHAAYDAWG